MLKHKFELVQCVLAFSLCAFVGCAPAESEPDTGRPGRVFEEFYFDNHFSDLEYEQISDSIGFLEKIHIDPNADTGLRSIYKISDSSGSQLRKWLSSRVKYFLSPRTEPRYFRRSKMPFALGSHMVLMTNWGSAVWNYCDESRLTCRIEVPGHPSVTVHSPRVGVVQIAEAAFKAWPADKPMSPYQILAALLHEGRHSDGSVEAVIDFSPFHWIPDRAARARRGTSAFSHVDCPPGHVYEGSLVCDLARNGAYAVASEFLKAVLGSNLLSPADRGELQSAIFDYESRILHGHGATDWDDAPQDVRGVLIR